MPARAAAHPPAARTRKWPRSTPACRCTGSGHTDAKGRPAFTYAVTWPSGSATPDTFHVNTGNQCRLGQAVCGVSNDACRVVCAGQCSATLVACPFGTAAWVQVGNQARTLVSRRVSAAGPASKCR